MDKDYIVRLLNQFEALEGDAGDRDAWMNEIFHYCIPHRYNQKYNGLETEQALPDDIYNSAMIQAAEIFSSGMFSYLTNPASKWCELRPKDKKQMTLAGVPEYFENTTLTIFDILAESNFYHEIKAFFLDLSVGNAVLYAEEDEDEVVRFFCINPMTCYWKEGINGKVTSVFRKFKMTADNVYERFGDSVSEKILKAVKDGKGHTLFEIVHVVRPRWKRDVSKIDNLNKKFESIYFEKDAKNVLSESGYDYFPYFVARYIKNSGQEYGYGPGNISIYDGKMLNQTTLSMIRGMQKDIDPPISAPSDSFVLPILQDPGSINIRTSMDANDRIEAMRGSTNYQAVFEFIKYIVSNINSAFHVDLFLAITEQTKRMTIPEVNERIAEKFPMLGSILNRIIDEAISPLIIFVYDVAARAGALPPVPPSLLDTSYSIKYVSPLSKSQKVSEIRSLQAALQLAATIGQFDPNALDNFNFDKISRESIDVVGAPNSFLRSEQEISFIRESRQKAIQAEQQKQEMMQAVEGASVASKADLNLAKAVPGAKR